MLLDAASPLASPGGDTAWVLTSAALVLLMTPGLAFFYGGMVRAKSVLNMMMMSIITIGIVSILWVLYGFSVAFGDTGNGFWGGLARRRARRARSARLADNGGGYPIPALAFSMFQLMFAIITPALISGAIADRAKFLGWGIFVTFWVTLVYFPVAHWVFDFGGSDLPRTGAGWLADSGVEDFAGGTAVHINAGAAGLALALVLGKRIGWPKTPIKPHNLPLVMLGAGLLWFGWFGFNAGSALAANQTAGARVHQHPGRHRRRRARLARRGEAPRRPPDHARRRLRRRRRPGRHHPGLCVHRAVVGDPARRPRRRVCAPRGRPEVQVRLRRLARRRRRPPRRRHRRLPVPRLLRHHHASGYADRRRAVLRRRTRRCSATRRSAPGRCSPTRSRSR